MYPNSSRNTNNRGALVDQFLRETEHGSQLTMGIIGCLPDNVQQAIKSFSIRSNKQHITFAFPFMEDSIRNFHELSVPSSTNQTPSSDRFQYISTALFFYSCPEVIYGFETLVTLVPQSNRDTHHTVGILTINQKDSSEGIKQHFKSLIRILYEQKSPHNLWQIPLVAVETSEEKLKQIISTCAEVIVEIHGDTLSKMHPSRTPQQLLSLTLEEIVRPCFLTFKELLKLNVQEVTSRLSSTDPSYFHSLLELLQSINCSLVDYRKIDMFFTSTHAEPALQEFWKIWSHDQIAAKIFPITSATQKLGLKEKSTERNKSCNCSVCWTESCSRSSHRSSRRYEGLGVSCCNESKDSAFHRPTPYSPYDRCPSMYPTNHRVPLMYKNNGFSYRLKENINSIPSQSLRQFCNSNTRNSIQLHQSSPTGYSYLDTSFFLNVQNYYSVASSTTVTPSSYPSIWSAGGHKLDRNVNTDEQSRSHDL